MKTKFEKNQFYTQEYTSLHPNLVPSLFFSLLCLGGGNKRSGYETILAPRSITFIAPNWPVHADSPYAVKQYQDAMNLPCAKKVS